MHFYGDMLGVWARTGLGVGAEVWKLSEFIQYFHLGSGSDNQVPTLIGLPSMNLHCMSANVSDGGRSDLHPHGAFTELLIQRGRRDDEMMRGHLPCSLRANPERHCGKEGTCHVRLEGVRAWNNHSSVNPANISRRTEYYLLLDLGIRAGMDLRCYIESRTINHKLWPMELAIKGNCRICPFSVPRQQSQPTIYRLK